MPTAALSTLVLASALLCVRAEHAGARLQLYVFKPLTTALILLVALQAKHAPTPAYRPLIVAGLVCSLAGDVFLMLPRERFVAGLLSFLFAHLFYIAAFVSGGAGASSWSAWAGAALLAYGASMLRLLWPRLGSLKAPVLVYVGVILLMVWLALGRWLGAQAPGSGLAAAGALLFAASDSLLAWNRFRGEFASAPAIILVTYFPAQLLIALST